MKQKDELRAMRAMWNTLQGFENDARSRILNWLVSMASNAPRPPAPIQNEAPQAELF